MILLKLVVISTFSVFVIVLTGIVFPDLIYYHVKNKKVEKFLEHDLVKAYWSLLTIVVDMLLIMRFIDFIC